MPHASALFPTIPNLAFSWGVHQCPWIWMHFNWNTSPQGVIIFLFLLDGEPRIRGSTQTAPYRIRPKPFPPEYCILESIKPITRWWTFFFYSNQTLIPKSNPDSAVGSLCNLSKWQRFTELSECLASWSLEGGILLCRVSEGQWRRECESAVNRMT